MCIDLAAYVEARVFERLTSRGVPPRRAQWVAKKVRRRYEAKRLAHRAQVLESAARARELDQAIVDRLYGGRDDVKKLDRVQGPGDADIDLTRH